MKPPPAPAGLGPVSAAPPLPRYSSAVTRRAHADPAATPPVIGHRVRSRLPPWHRRRVPGQPRPIRGRPSRISLPGSRRPPAIADTANAALRYLPAPEPSAPERTSRSQALGALDLRLTASPWRAADTQGPQASRGPALSSSSRSFSSSSHGQLRLADCSGNPQRITPDRTLPSRHRGGCSAVAFRLPARCRTGRQAGQPAARLGAPRDRPPLAARAPVLGRSERHHCRSRAAVGATGLNHSRIGDTQPRQHWPRLRQLSFGRRSLDRQHPAARPRQANAQAGQLVQRRHRARGHDVGQQRPARSSARPALPRRWRRPRSATHSSGTRPAAPAARAASPSRPAAASPARCPAGPRRSPGRRPCALGGHEPRHRAAVQQVPVPDLVGLGWTDDPALDAAPVSSAAYFSACGSASPNMSAASGRHTLPHGSTSTAGIAHRASEHASAAAAAETTLAH